DRASVTRPDMGTSLGRRADPAGPGRRVYAAVVRRTSGAVYTCVYDGRGSTAAVEGSHVRRVRERNRRRTSGIAIVLAAMLGAVTMVASAPAGADPQATVRVSCDRPNTGIDAGLFVNLNNEIPDPLESDSLMQVVDAADPAVPGQPAQFTLRSEERRV